MRGMVLGIVALATLSGCSFGLGDTVTFVTRNLSVSGQLADGAFASTEGTIQVLATSQDGTDGVDIELQGTDGSRSVFGILSFDGNLGALCPGSYVELEGEGGSLSATDFGGAPLESLDELADLRLNAQIDAVEESLAPSRMTMTSSEGTGGFAVMRFASTTVVEGEERTVEGTFEVARVVESTDTPGWEGETWEGMPVASWD